VTGGRSLVEFVCPQEVDERTMVTPLAPAPARCRPLVGDVGAGDGAALVSLPAGWRAAGAPASPCELIVLSGTLHADGIALGRHGYVSTTPAAGSPALFASEAALVFLDAHPLIGEARIVRFEDERWLPGRFPGRSVKIVRGDADGARGFFYRIPAGSRQPRTEWHDCAEAGLMLAGDLWHVRANGGLGGTMREHCYFWRPPRALHSPMGSDGGALMWLYVDGPLVNHYLDDEGEPPAGVG